MSKIVAFALIFLTGSVLAKKNDGLDVLVGEGSTDSSLIIKRQATLSLNDPFLIQIYSKHKALNSKNPLFNAQMDLLFEGKNADYIKLGLDKSYSDLEKSVVVSARMYALWKEKLYHTFFRNWLEVIKEKNSVVDSELMLALDQVITAPMSEWFVKNGIYLSSEDKELVLSFNSSSLFHKFVKAWALTRKGDTGLEYVKYLESGSTLSYLLARSAIVDFAKKGELKQAGKLLKEVVGPYLERTQDVNSITLYYLDLGRLLFQAGAYEESLAYFRKVPKTSPLYLKAKTESLWVLLTQKDYSTLQGELESFDLNLFDESFIPDAYLVGAISNLKLCKFEKTQTAFKSFVRANKNHAKHIEDNIKSDSPRLLTKEDFYINNLITSTKELTQELKRLDDYKSLTSEKELFQNRLSVISKQLEGEKRRKWNNRKKILNKSIFEMRFVKIEFLSKMRNLSLNLASNTNKQDSVSTFRAKNAVTGQIEFPYDGIPFGDEIFHLRGDIENLCKRGLK